jgi:hypothetical protein
MSQTFDPSLDIEFIMLITVSEKKALPGAWAAQGNGYPPGMGNLKLDRPLTELKGD